MRVSCTPPFFYPTHSGVCMESLLYFAIFVAYCAAKVLALYLLLGDDNE